MKAAIIIPARYASTRLPAKMLLEAGGKPLIQHVYERALAAKRAQRVIVATDDERIARAVRGFGGEAVMTDPAHTSGSARAAEAARALDSDIIVNVQGDEPEIDPAYIDRLIALQARAAPFCSTLVCPFPKSARPDDPSAVKAVLGAPVLGEEGAFNAISFTRSLAEALQERKDELLLHIGVYAFRADALQAFARAPESQREKIERLEQLRVIEMGETILAALVPAAAPGVDTAEDFAAFKARVENRN
ncbi:MAG TPA: 3-deoxy-manno-octulosonate cytidylyltransferase [Parvularculaceae bacterium]|nr:3-deoxy-manno-octulosonate cytidylyltransferase [Parvularculaceae bacterium]